MSAVIGVSVSLLTGLEHSPERETGCMVDNGCWKQVWAEMADAELEDRLFTLHTPNAHAGPIRAQN